MAEDRREPPPAIPPPNSPPSFGRLLASNLRVVAWTAVLALVAYGVWRGLALLFPETDWLQLKP